MYARHFDGQGGSIFMQGDAPASVSVSPNTYGQFHVPNRGEHPSLASPLINVHGLIPQWMIPERASWGGEPYEYHANGIAQQDAAGALPDGPLAPHLETFTAAAGGDAATAQAYVCPAYGSLRVRAASDSVHLGESTRLIAEAFDTRNRVIRPCGGTARVSAAVSRRDLAELLLNGAPLADTATVALNDLLDGTLTFRARATPTARTGVTVTLSHGPVPFVNGGHQAPVTVVVSSRPAPPPPPPPPPVLRLLRQDDRVIPSVGQGAFLMVSKFRPDDRLLPTSPFPSGIASVAEDSASAAGNGGGDRFTFRPQITGLDDVTADEVRFRLRVTRPRADGTDSRVVFRAGDGQSSDAGGQFYEYRAVDGIEASGAFAFRANQFIRLVSNSVPTEGGPEGSRYDDEHAGAQTVRVELGDKVEVSVVIDGRERPERVRLAIGLPPGEDGRHAIRTADVSFARVDGIADELPFRPDETLARANEDWAQVAVRFKRAGDVRTVSPSVSYLLLSGTRHYAVGGGAVVLDLERGGLAARVSVQVQMNELSSEVATRLAEAITLSPLGIVAQMTRVVQEAGYAYGVALSQPLGLVNADMAATGLRVNQPRLLEIRDRDYGLLSIFGLTSKDDLDETIDVIMVPPYWPGLGGASGSGYGDVWGDGYPGLRNTVFVIPPVLTADDVLDSGILAHELGHVLLNDAQGEHDLSCSNLMAPGPGDARTWCPESKSGPQRPFERLDGRRRLSSAQHDAARLKSETASPVTLLQRK